MHGNLWPGSRASRGARVAHNETWTAIPRPARPEQTPSARRAAPDSPRGTDSRRSVDPGARALGAHAASRRQPARGLPARAGPTRGLPARPGACGSFGLANWRVAPRYGAPPRCAVSLPRRVAAMRAERRPHLPTDRRMASALAAALARRSCDACRASDARASPALDDLLPEFETLFPPLAGGRGLQPSLVDELQEWNAYWRAAKEAKAARGAAAGATARLFVSRAPAAPCTTKHGLLPNPPSPASVLNRVGNESAASAATSADESDGGGHGWRPAHRPVVLEAAPSPLDLMRGAWFGRRR